MRKRRRFLEALAVGAAGVAGCLTDDQPSTTTETGTETTATTTESVESRLADRFDTVVDMQDLHGIDGTASTRIDGALQKRAGDDTVFYFPKGRYRIGSVLFEDVSNFGFVGDDATFVLDQPGRHVYMGFRRVEDVLFRGFKADNSADNMAAWLDFKTVGGTNVIKDYTVTDFDDVEGRTHGFTLMIEGGDTSLTVENVDLSKGVTTPLRRSSSARRTSSTRNGSPAR
ncbi:hypothetical protein VB773_22045 [Haloarculaceae archaeon H-GB2-1]|nr:hypothetical protein [Haloarculaceae archaeon H-GB2-1]